MTHRLASQGFQPGTHGAASLLPAYWPGASPARSLRVNILDLWHKERPARAVQTSYSAARRAGSATGSRMVTNSSAAVGWMPTVASKTCLVAPALIATAIP